jgi:hypothetical protein
MSNGTATLPGTTASAPPQTIDALPVTVNLSLYAGDDFWLDLSVTNPDGSEADLEGLAALAQIRRTPTDLVVLAEFDSEIVGNVIRLHLTNQSSAALTGKAVWDCHLTNGTVSTLAAGRVTITQPVSKP